MIGTEGEEDELRRLEAQLNDEAWIDRTPSVVTLDVRARVVELKRSIAERTPQPVIEQGNLPPPWVGLWQPLPLYDGAEQPPPQREAAAPTPAASTANREDLRHQLFELVANPYFLDRARFRALFEAAGNDVTTLRLLAAASLRAGAKLATAVNEKLNALRGPARPVPTLDPTRDRLPGFSDATALPDLHDGLTGAQRHLLRTVRLIAPAGGQLAKTPLVLAEALETAPYPRDELERAVVELGHPLLRRLPLIEGSIPARRVPERTAIDAIRLSAIGEAFLAGDLALPLLLINGASGPETTFPPWNPSEVLTDALWFLREGGPVPTRYLRAQAPDFPVEGLLLRGQMHNLRYHGHGTLLLQSRLTLEIDHAHRRGRVVVTGLPWPLRVPEVLERLRQLELEGVTAVHDESTVDTPKLLIELEHAAFGWEVQRAITASGVVSLKFEARMRVSADAAPRTVTVDEVLQVFIADQLAVERRTAEAENRRLQQRVANAEAVVVALALDQPILAALRHTDDDEQAVPLLMNLMTPPLRAQLESLGELSHDWARGFTEPQARHVLSVRKLWSKQRATAFREWEALKDELSSATIDEAQLRRAVIEKLERARERFGSPRRTIPH